MDLGNMMDFFGSLPRLNWSGRERSNSKSQKTKEQVSRFRTFGETSKAKTGETNDSTYEESVKEEPISDGGGLETKENEKESLGNVSGESNLDVALETKEIKREAEMTDDEEAETRDKFEMHNTTFYRVLTKSFYEQNINVLMPFKKRDEVSALKSSTKRAIKTTKTLRERKMVISSPQNFQRVENELTMILKKEAENMGLGTLKKSVSLDNLLRDDDEFTDEDRFKSLENGRSLFSSVGDLTFEAKKLVDEENSTTELVETSSEIKIKFSTCDNCGYDHCVPFNCETIDISDETKSASLEKSEKESDIDCDYQRSESEEDIDKVVEEFMSNLVTMRDKSQSTPELLKSINQFPKERIERPSENKFPLDDENVEVRRRPSIRRNRISKTTDFDLGRRKQESPINPKNFDIRGIVKFQKPIGGAVITKLNQEYVAYENENFYRINEKTKSKELLCQNVFLKSARYLNSRSKESKEVELRDCQNFTYVLYFDSIKYAKQFMENEKIQVYVTDNKVTIKKTLLRFLGKRSSREILERKGIYKNEPIFGNTLRDIYIKGAGISTSPVPLFIYRVIELIERPENIKSLGLYRTSGNLAIIQKIRCEVDNGKLDILDQFCKDPDVLTGSLKLFFRELKEPLIPTEVCEKMAEIVKLNPKQMSARDFQKIKSILVKNLHEANLETLIVVIQHLLNVVKYKEHNKMDTYNLAVCWGPSMIFSVHGASPGSTFDFPKDIVTQSHDATRLVDFLLGFYELYPGELSSLTKRPENTTGKILALKRQESRDSVESSDSSKSQKKSSSNLSLSVDEITKKLIDMIDPHLSSEGLYKKTGSTDKTNKIFKKLNKKKIGELDKYKNDIYDLADALKKYLKDQDGLVTKDTIELVLRATSDTSQSYLEPINRRKVTALIEDTPKKDTFTFLLRHLAKVIDHQSRQNVSRNEIINIWTNVLNYQKKCQVSDDEFAKFLTVAVEVLNDNLPDIVRSSFNNNGSTPNRNEIMGEVVKQIKIQQERDRHSRYDNVDCDVTGEASILDDKTEQTKL